MHKRIVGLITLVCFCVLSAGCHSSRAVSMMELRGNPNHKIGAVVTKDGRIYQFDTERRDGSGRLVGDVVTCGVPGPNCREIPVEDIDTVYITFVDPAKTTIGVIGVSVALVGTMFIIALAMKESCPFVYSFDGDQYVFDGEPYGGAICPALQRVDLCQLEHLRPYDGKYLLQLTNEVNETQYTDEFKLWVVDHPRGTRAIPDSDCRLHTIERPLSPLDAREGSGRDISLWLSEKDPRVWESDIGHKDPEVKGDLRDTLLLTFAKPRGAKQAKLVVNGCNSLWSSHMLRRFLELHGARAKGMLERLEDPDTLASLTELLDREESFLLKVRVWSRGEWVEKGRIMGGGPFISEDRVILLDVGDVDGDELRVLLAPPAGFWRFDWFAVDYSDDAACCSQEVAATSIVGDGGKNLSSALGATDGIYHVMPEVGQGAALEFPVPPHEGDSERTVFAKVSGYYDIHLDGGGPPSARILSQILREPGYVVKYSLKEYQDWRERRLAARNQ